MKSKIQQMLFLFHVQKEMNLSKLQIHKLELLLMIIDNQHSVEWDFDGFTLYGHFGGRRFIMFTHDEYFRLDIRYDVNEYRTRIVYDLDDNYEFNCGKILSDIDFISCEKTYPEINMWAEYVLNYDTGEENPLTL